MVIRLRVLLIAGVIIASPAAGQEEPAEHWAVALGRRVDLVDRAFPLVDQVVLVPDAATYVDELSRWSPQGRWPVLFEDEQLAPMFIRRFQPSRVVRREPAASLPHQAPKKRALIEGVITRTWGADPATRTVREAFEARGHTPPGVVFTSLNDPAWTAAVALAAGRGQPIAWLEKRFGEPNRLLAARKFGRLVSRIEELVAEAGYPHTTLGDAIDTITLCRRVAGRVDISADPNAQEVRAMTDLIGRRADGRRFAFAGWIFGDERRCAYVAMCSLFLARDRVWLYNTYPDTEGWRVYGMEEAAAALATAGYQTTAFSGDQATSRAWLNLLPGGISTDVLAMNTKGNAQFFDLAEGRAYARDVPVLNEPVALHLIHSWSMRSPESTATVGGQWLARGVYAYVGSTDEPQLGAFMPPAELAARWMSAVPFLISARRLDETARPWKINTFGDPLMLCPPPQGRQRIPPTAEGGLDLAAHAKTLMQQSASDESGETIEEAIRTLTLLGEDGIAIRMWQLARQRGVQSSAAGIAVDPIFRARRADDFLDAWRALPHRNDHTTDMLWHLMTPRLGSATDQDLLLLQAAVRPSQCHADLGRLAPHLSGAFGSDHTRSVIAGELEKATTPYVRKRLEKMLRAPTGRRGSD